MNRGLLGSVAAAAAVALSGAAARADFVIDTFALPNPTPNPTYSLSNVGDTFNLSTPLPGGVTRTVFVRLVGNSQGDSAAATGVVGTPASGPPRFSLNTVSGATAYASLTYTFAGPQDLSAATDFRFNVSFADQLFPFSVQLTDADGVSATDSGFATAGSYQLSMDDFAGIDTTRVASVVLSLNRDTANLDQPSTTSADFTLVAAGFDTPQSPQSAVPAPPAVLLGLLALPALAWRARRSAGRRVGR